MLAISVNKIMKHLHNRIVGQKKALNVLNEALTVAAAGIGDENRPICVLLFAGPTGVGKSETVIALAEAIHNDGNYLNRIDCNNLKEPHTIASLVGSPPGYVGYYEGSSLLNKEKIEGKPGRPGIVVFEEFEKAHPDVCNGLLGIFDKGSLMMNSARREVSFKNSIVIMTSNVGARELAKEAANNQIGFRAASVNSSPASIADNIVNKEMERIFKPELIGRIDETIVFNWLTMNDAELIVKRLFWKFQRRISKLGLYLELSHDVIRIVAEKGFNPKLGARPINQAFHKHIVVPIAKRINASGGAFSKFDMFLQNNQIEIVQSARFASRAKQITIGQPN